MIKKIHSEKNPSAESFLDYTAAIGVFSMDLDIVSPRLLINGRHALSVRFQICMHISRVMAMNLTWYWLIVGSSMSLQALSEISAASSDGT